MRLKNKLQNQLLFSNSNDNFKYKIKKNNIKATFDTETNYYVEQNWKEMKGNYKKTRPLWNGEIYNLQSIEYIKMNEEILFEVNLINFKQALYFSKLNDYHQMNPMGVQVIIETLDGQLVFGTRKFENELLSLICGVVSPKEIKNTEDIFLKQTLIEIEEELGIKEHMLSTFKVMGGMKTVTNSFDIITYCTLNVNFEKLEIIYKENGNYENSNIIKCKKSFANLLEFKMQYNAILTEQLKSILNWIIQKKIII